MVEYGFVPQELRPFTTLFKLVSCRATLLIYHVLLSSITLYETSSPRKGIAAGACATAHMR